MVTPSFRIPSPEEITPPQPEIASRRGPDVMAHILNECYGNFDDRVAVEACYRLGYSVFAIGSEYFFAAVDKARHGATVTVLTPYPEWS